MKKFLSLVLALVMTMSLVTIGAGAKDFTDGDTVTYNEAIDVMSALKVIDGYTDGSFKPTTQLNRGQAAKILCNMILGPTTASALKADAAPFKDVAADNTFAAYIAFCAKEGIIDGYTDGTFKPAAPLTGYAFMKFLLGALGYDKDIEGYNGNNWSINVAKRALNIGLDDGLTADFDGTKIVTREEACLFAFNALTADMVHYGNKTTVSIGGAEVVVGAGEATKNTNAKANDYRKTAANRDEVEQFCERYFPKLELDDAAGMKDAFDRPANTWYIKNDKIDTYTKAADLTYHKNVDGKTIYKDLDNSDYYSFAVYVDGDLKGNQTLSKTEKSKLGDLAGAVVGNGSLVEVFEDEQRITVVNEYLLQVAGDYNEKKETLTLAPVTGFTAPAMASYTLDIDDFAGLDEFKDEDYVIVTASYNGTNYDIQSIQLAEKVTGAVTEFVDKDTVTAGGTQYSYAVGTTNTIKNFQYVLKDEYNLYLNSEGYVMLQEGVEAEDNVIYITEFAPSSLLTTNGKVKAFAYFLDGTEDEITVSKLGSTKVDASDLTGGSRNTLNSKTEGWYKFSEKNGSYELRELTLNTDYTLKKSVTPNTTVVDYKASTTTRTAITDGTNNYKGNATTKFVVVKPNGDVVTYTGIKNVPQIVAKGTSDMAVIFDGAYAKYVFIKLGNGSTIKGGSTSSDMAYIIKVDATWGHDTDGDTYYRYKVILNGEEKKVIGDTALSLTPGMLYSEISYNSKGYIVDAEAVKTSTDTTNPVVDTDVFDVEDLTTVAAGSAAVTLKKQTINFINGSSAVEGSYFMADGAKVYVCNTTDEEVDVYTPSQFVVNFEDVNSKAVTVFGVMNADGEYSALYVVAAL